MTHEQREHWRRRPTAAFLRGAGAVLAALLSPATHQTIRGLEACTAEKQMERRTGCLQANVELLQQALLKLARETRDKIAASGRDLAAVQAELAPLKSTIDKLNNKIKRKK